MGALNATVSNGAMDWGNDMSVTPGEGDNRGAIFIEAWGTEVEQCMRELEEIGFKAVQVSNLSKLPPEPMPSVFVIRIESRYDRLLLKEASRSCSAPIVALVSRLSRLSVMPLLSCGACSLIDEEIPPGEAAETIRQASMGFSRFPAWLTRPEELKGEISERQVEWLRLLEDDSLSITDIAKKTAWSRAEVYRRLQPIFEVLGVSTRGEAVRRARDLGILL